MFMRRSDHCHQSSWTQRHIRLLTKTRRKRNVIYSFLKSENYLSLGNPIGGQQALNTGLSGGVIASVTSSKTGIVSSLYESSGDEFSETEDVENPNYSAFCQGLQDFWDFQQSKFDRIWVNPLSVSLRSLKLAQSSEGRPQQQRRHRMLVGILSNSTHYLRERQGQRSRDEKNHLASFI